MTDLDRDILQKIKKARQAIDDNSIYTAGLRSEASTKKKEIVLANQAYQILKRELETLIGLQKLTVSDHAIIRYLERIKGMDVDVIREVIRQGIISEHDDAIETLGGGKYYHPDFFWVVIRGRVVTTITTNEMEK